jgi:hypothetical protein
VWLPNALGGKGAMLKYGGDSRRFMLYSPDENAWPYVRSNLLNGQHAVCAHHPVLDRVLMLGGSNTPLLAALVDNTGAATRVADLPAKCEMSVCGWIMPHTSGAFVVRTTEPENLYVYWPQHDRWDLLGPAPDAALNNPTVAHYRDDIWLNAVRQGLYAYRLPEVS